MGLGSSLARLPLPVREALRKHLYPPMLKESETAPEWHLQAHDRSWHRLGPYWAVMQFLPYEPQSELVRSALRELQEHHAELSRLGARVYAIFPAEEPQTRALAEELGLDFPLLTDRGASVSRLFRAAIQLPLRPIVIPTLYLVNPKRQIRMANRGTPSIAAVVRSIQALQEATKEGL